MTNGLLRTLNSAERSESLGRDHAGDGLLAWAGVLTFTGLTALGAHVAVPLPPFGVPQTLQTLAVVLAALCLGPRLGAGAMALYVLMGIVGVPVFAGGEYGPAVLFGQTGGYLLGFIACQPIVCRIVRRSDGRARGLWWIPVGVLAGHAVVFALGVPWLYAVRTLDPLAPAITLGQALHGGMVVFLPGMVIKAAVATVIGYWAVPWSGRRGW